MKFIITTVLPVSFVTHWRWKECEGGNSLMLYLSLLLISVALWITIDLSYGRFLHLKGAFSSIIFGKQNTKKLYVYFSLKLFLICQHWYTAVKPKSPSQPWLWHLQIIVELGPKPEKHPKIIPVSNSSSNCFVYLSTVPPGQFRKLGNLQA